MEANIRSSPSTGPRTPANASATGATALVLVPVTPPALCGGVDAISDELSPAFAPLPTFAAATGLRPEEWQAAGAPSALNLNDWRRRIWTPAVESAGIALRARSYDMRSTFASNALAAGI
jgi:hypothetical protein